MNLLREGGLCCTNRLKSEVPLPRTDLSHSFRDGYAERGVAVQDGDADLEFGNLTVEVQCHEPLAQQFHAVHLCLDAAPTTQALDSPHERPVRLPRQSRRHTTSFSSLDQYPRCLVLWHFSGFKLDLTAWLNAHRPPQPLRASLTCKFGYPQIVQQKPHTASQRPF